MEPRKPVPRNSTDRRRTHPIDELRAKAWIHYVSTQTELKSSYALAKRYGGEAKKWKNYFNGGQPNDDVLNAVDQELPGSRSYYTSGPKSLKLWPALELNQREKLQLIAENSEKVDGEIARLRIAAENGTIPVDCSSGCIGDELHPYDLRLMDIFHQLKEILSKELASLAFDILYEHIDPYRENADRLAQENFYDFIIPRRNDNLYAKKIISTENYLSIELGTIKSKGKRKISN